MYLQIPLTFKESWEECRLSERKKNRKTRQHYCVVTLPDACLESTFQRQSFIGEITLEKDLSRFRDAQERDYQQALVEIKNGRKETHWMWYIFPQIHGLGSSSISQYYAIKDLQEARDFLKDPILGKNLNEICKTLLAVKTDDPHGVFGSPDDMKLLSCMTLFEQADPENQVFPKVIEKFYHGRRDQKTLEILQNEIPPELGDRKIYDTPIGSVCMSKTEHEAYMKERRIRESREKKR